MSTADPYAPRRVCVTVKVPESKKYAGDNPWFVFEGDVAGVKEMVAEAFGLEVGDLSLVDVTINAQRVASGLGNVAHGLGGTVLSKGPAESSQAPETPANDVWAQAAAAQGGSAPAPQTEKAPADPILSAIDGCGSIPELQQVWAENQAAFNGNPAYMDAYKAKGRSLS